MINISDNFVEKIKTDILCSVTFFFRKSCVLWHNVGKYCKAGQATDDNMAHAHWMLDTWSYKHILRICNIYFFPHCNSSCTKGPHFYVILKNKFQLDVTYYFIVLMIGSTCFGHHYAHHQELTTIALVLELLLSRPKAVTAFNPDTHPSCLHLTPN